MLLTRNSVGYAPLAGSAPKANPADDLSEVAVKVKPVAVTEVEEDLPEIVVSSRRVPWYVWALGGVFAFAALDKVLGSR